MSRTRSLVLGVVAAVAVAMVLIVDPFRRDDARAPLVVDRNSIVLLGDSITAQGDWSSLLPGEPVVNAGFPGFTTSQLVPVAVEVAAGEPRSMFILTGTNDVRDGLPPAATVDALSRVLDAFAEAAPSTRVVVQTVLPRSEKAAAIAATNVAIVDLATRREIEVLDLHAAFDDGTGGLRPAETTEGWHLSERGYERWAALLVPELTASGQTR